MMKKMILTLILGLGLAQVSAVDTAPKAEVKKASLVKRAWKPFLVGVGAVAALSFILADNDNKSFFSHKEVPEVIEVKDATGAVTTAGKPKVVAIDAAKKEWLVAKFKGMPAGFMKLVSPLSTLICPMTLNGTKGKEFAGHLTVDILVWLTEAAALIALGDYIIRADKSLASKLAGKAKGLFSKKATLKIASEVK